MQDGEEARSNDLEAAMGSRKTHPFFLTLRNKEDERNNWEGC